MNTTGSKKFGHTKDYEQLNNRHDNPNKQCDRLSYG